MKIILKIGNGTPREGDSLEFAAPLVILRDNTGAAIVAYCMHPGEMLARESKTKSEAVYAINQ